MVEEVSTPGGAQDNTLAVNIRKCIYVFITYVCVAVYIIYWYDRTCI